MVRYDTMRPVGPIETLELFTPLRIALVELLRGLSKEEWELPTVCKGWSVKDVAAHLLAGDVGVLSRLRDTYYSPHIAAPQNWDELVKLINWLNETWVAAMWRVSPRVLCDLLATMGPQIEAHFASLDPLAPGPPVDWAGEGPQPNWMDLAREYTERWHHQQQIRDAVHKPGMREERFQKPVLDAFVRAVPHTLRKVEAPAGTEIQISVTGDSGGEWVVRREAAGWNLWVGHSPGAKCEVVVTEDRAWRIFTKQFRGEAAVEQAAIRGDARLGRAVLGTVSIIG